MGEQENERWERIEKWRKMRPVTSFIFFFSLWVKKKGQNKRENVFCPTWEWVGEEKGKNRPAWNDSAVFVVMGKCLCRCGEVSGLARAVCYQGFPGPPGRAELLAWVRGLSLREGEESKPLPKDGWEAIRLERGAQAWRGLGIPHERSD